MMKLQFYIVLQYSFYPVKKSDNEYWDFLVGLKKKLTKAAKLKKLQALKPWIGVSFSLYIKQIIYIHTIKLKSILHFLCQSQ